MLSSCVAELAEARADGKHEACLNLKVVLGNSCISICVGAGVMKAQVWVSGKEERCIHATSVVNLYSKWLWDFLEIPGERLVMVERRGGPNGWTFLANRSSY